MSYGIQIKNASDKVILDSDEGSPVLVQVRNGTFTPLQNRHNVGTGYTVSQETSYASLASSPTLLHSDTIIAHRNTSGYLGHDVRSGTDGINPGIFATTSAGSPVVKWVQIKGINASGLSNHNSGYGLNVFDGTGTAVSNLLFSTNATSALQIVEVGTFDPPAGAGNYYKDITINSTEEHYALISTSAFWLQDIILFNSGAIVKEQLACYEYIYSGTTLQTIRLHSALYDYGGNASSVTITRIDNPSRIFIIFKIRS